MQLFVERENEKQEITFSGTAQELLTKLSINPQTVLVLKNKSLVTEDEELSNEDSVDILSVVSGG